MSIRRPAKILFALACMSAAACVQSAEPVASRVLPDVAAQHARDDSASLILLGTAGGPIARSDRAGIATLLTIGTRRYLIDAGEGVVHQLGRAGLQATDVPTVLLTHLHDDHYAGLPGLASFAYTLRGRRLSIAGPVGTKVLGEGIKTVMMPSARIRMVENRLPLTPAEFLEVREYVGGEILDDGNVRVTALANTHFNLPTTSDDGQAMSYSLKFQGQGRTVVFTGDTGPSTNVTAFARGADVLVAEMASLADRESVPPAVRSHMDVEHLSPLEVGKLASQARVKTLVLSHVGVVGEADLAIIRSVYRGKIVLGADLMKLEI